LGSFVGGDLFSKKGRRAKRPEAWLGSTKFFGGVFHRLGRGFSFRGALVVVACSLGLVGDARRGGKKKEAAGPPDFG